MKSKKRDWKELCEAASKEFDPQRLLALVSELTEVLSEESANLAHIPKREMDTASI